MFLRLYENEMRSIYHMTFYFQENILNIKLPENNKIVLKKKDNAIYRKQQAIV